MKRPLTPGEYREVALALDYWQTILADGYAGEGRKRKAAEDRLERAWRKIQDWQEGPAR